MAEYISENPKIVSNGFIKAGITGALDGNEEDLTDLDSYDDLGTLTDENEQSDDEAEMSDDEEMSDRQE